VKSTQERIKKMIAATHIPSKELGIWIGYEKGVHKDALFVHNADKKFIPASLSKVVTAVVTLKKLPLNHKFKTQIYTSAKIQKGVLKGDLYLKGGGDPIFTSESMWELVNNFTRSGISKIDGNIIVDDKFFDSERFALDREDTRVDRAYNAPVGAMSFNWNSVNVYVRPGKNIGDPVKLVADPQSEYIKVINKAVTLKGSAKTIRVSRVIDPSRSGDTILVAGGLGILHDEVVVYKNITQPDYWSGYQLKEFLRQRRITVTGEIKTGKVPSQADLAAENESLPLAVSIAAMLKFSNNFVAEMLTKNMSADINQIPGSIINGLTIIRQYLEHNIGLAANNYSFVNPSGLTRENVFRPVDLGKVLNFAKDDFTIYPEFLGSLPVAGTDGTLKDRMNGTDAEGWVRAKTGMLTGVLGLAGYAGRQNGNELTFVFMFNGEPKRMTLAARLFDHLAELLVK